MNIKIIIKSVIRICSLIIILFLMANYLIEINNMHANNKQHEQEEDISHIIQLIFVDFININGNLYAKMNLINHSTLDFFYSGYGSEIPVIESKLQDEPVNPVYDLEFLVNDEGESENIGRCGNGIKTLKLASNEEFSFTVSIRSEKSPFRVFIYFRESTNQNKKFIKVYSKPIYLYGYQGK